MKTLERFEEEVERFKFLVYLVEKENKELQDRINYLETKVPGR